MEGVTRQTGGGLPADESTDNRTSQNCCVPVHAELKSPTKLTAALPKSLAKILSLSAGDCSADSRKVAFAAAFSFGIPAIGGRHSSASQSVMTRNRTCGCDDNTDITCFDANNMAQPSC